MRDTSTNTGDNGNTGELNENFPDSLPGNTSPGTKKTLEELEAENALARERIQKLELALEDLTIHLPDKAFQKLIKPRADLDSEQFLRRQADVNKLFGHISRQFLDNDLDRAIDEVLESLGNYVEADRAYLFAFDLDKNTFSNTHEFCAPDIAPEIDTLQNLPLDEYGWRLDFFLRGFPLLLPRVNELTQEAARLRKFLISRSVRSTLCVPLNHKDNVIGVLGFEAIKQERSWKHDELNLIITAGELISIGMIRNRVEQALIFSEARLGAVTSNSADILSILNTRANCSYISASVERLLGYRDTELIGNSLENFIHTEDLTNFRTFLHLTLENPETVFTQTYRFRHKNGEYRYLESRARNLLDEDHIQGILLNTADITERIDARRALRDSENRYRRLFSKTQIALAGTEEHARRLSLLNELSQKLTMAENDEGIVKVAIGYISRIIMANMVSVSLVEQSQESARLFIMDRLRDSMETRLNFPLAGALLEEALQNQSLINIKNLEEYRRSDTAVFLKNDLKFCMIAPIVLGAHKLGTVAVAGKSNSYNERDENLLHHLASFMAITLENTRRNHKLLQATRDAENSRRQAVSANLAKSRFLANMSHELRTPLNGILGFTQILGARKNLSPRFADGIRIIQRSGEHLLNLINDILDLSRIEAGKVETASANFNLSLMLQNLAEIFFMRARQKNIVFHFEPTDDLPEGVRGDENKIRQILMNLLSNAVKFTDEGGVVLKVGYHKQKIRFQVEDTGVGIEPDSMKLIFKSFRQLGEQSRVSEGSGLGLAISSKLADTLGTRLKVSSKPGEGSRFWFELTLPATDLPPPHSQVGEKYISGYKGDRKLALIVDDKWENRSVLSHMLSPLGFKIDEAANGQDALDKTIRLKPDLVLLDLRMPIMNGFEVIRRVRGLPGIKNTIIITISASAFEHTRKESLAAGSDDFIPKPFKLKTLLDLIELHLNLEWVYEFPTDNPLQPDDSSLIISSAGSAQDYPTPTKEVLARLLDLAKMGDILAIQNMLEEITNSDPAFGAFTEKIKDYCSAFNIKDIINYIQYFLEESSN